MKRETLRCQWRKPALLAERQFVGRAVAVSLFAFFLLGDQLHCCAESKLRSGEPLRVGTDTGVGVFALPSISCSPLGTMQPSSAKQRSDLIVVSDRWHPALYLYRWKGDDPAGVPIFSRPIQIEAPFKEAAQSPSGDLFTDTTGQVYGVWLRSGKLIAAKFDAKNSRFKIVSQTPIDGLPTRPSRLLLKQSESGRLQGFVTVPDGIAYRTGSSRTKEYRPYDGAGVWRGGFPRNGIYRFTCDFPKLPQRITAHVVLPPNNGGLLGISSLEWIRPSSTRESQLLFGTKLGGIFYVPDAFEKTLDPTSATKIHVSDTRGRVIRHPAVGTNMTAYPATDGSRTHLIASGEGGMYYYRFANRLGKRGEPVFEPPREVMQESAELYSGSLVVPNVADWNGDGKLDIVAGNAAGHLLFFENQGANEQPRFLPATRIEAGGEPVLIRGGYRGSIQGPGEAHWGYTCPTVVDWNQDGLLDIVMNDIRGMHSVYLNRGTAKAPALALPRQLSVELLELHGTWRTRPAAGILGRRMAYVTLDDDDQIHLYWRIDDYNLEDGGKLLLTDGSPIQANFLSAGGTGRAKFQLIDWDRDGKVDLLVGTPRHSTFPEPKRGVPWSMNKAGSAVLLLKNVGTNDRPVYEYPSVMHVKGKSKHFGQHSCAPVATTLGGGGDWNLIVGTETGRMIFLHRDHIEWQTIR